MIVTQTSPSGVVRTIAVERKIRERRGAHRATLVYGRWHTPFGGWTSVPEWHLIQAGTR